jgi:hypothetical protein
MLRTGTAVVLTSTDQVPRRVWPALAGKGLRVFHEVIYFDKTMGLDATMSVMHAAYENYSGGAGLIS